MDQESFDLGRRGGHQGPDTDRESFLAGQNARRIELDNQKSANTSHWPSERTGPGGNGALGFALLFIAPFLLGMAIFALLPAWLLKYTTKSREGRAPIAWFRRYKAALVVVSVFGAVPALTLALGRKPTLSILAVSFLAGIALAGFAMKRMLPEAFHGRSGYLRACLQALFASVVANAIVTLAIVLLSMSLAPESNYVRALHELIGIMRSGLE